jgi:hypothetical protein
MVGNSEVILRPNPYATVELPENGDCGKFTRPETAQRELGENPTLRALRKCTHPQCV